MAEVRFRMNYGGIAMLASGPEMRRMAVEATKPLKQFAERISPRSQRQHKHYAESFDIESTLVPDIGGPPLGHMLRWGALLVNNSPHATQVELGVQGHGRDYPGHHVFERTLRHFASLHDGPRSG